MTGFFAAEAAYLTVFCRAEAAENGLRFRDAQLPELCAHNLLFLPEAPEEEALCALLRREAARCRAEGLPYLQLLVEGKSPFCAALAQRTLCDYYVLPGEIRRPRPDLALLPMDASTAGAALGFDLQVNGEPYGAGFIRRRFVRRLPVYLAGRVQHLLGWHAGRPVCACDLFLCGETAKIEDVDVAPAWQRRGFGRAMLAAAAYRARAGGAREIYLVVERGSGAQAAYEACGFVRAAAREELLFSSADPPFF